MDDALSFKVRVRDIVVGVTTCLLFAVLSFCTTQQPIVSTLASVILGYIAMLASTHLWSPWLRLG